MRSYRQNDLIIMANQEKSRVNLWVQADIKEKWQKLSKKLGRNLTDCILEAMHEFVLKYEPMTNEEVEIQEVKSELEKEREKNREIMGEVQELLVELRASKEQQPIHPELKDTILKVLNLNHASFDVLLGITKVEENILMDALAELQELKVVKSFNKEGNLLWGIA